MTPAKIKNISAIAATAFLAAGVLVEPLSAEELQDESPQALGLRATTPDDRPPEQPAQGNDEYSAGIDWSALNWDPATLSSQAKNLRAKAHAPAGANWARTDNKDGSAAVTVNRSLPTLLESKIGIDMNIPASQPAAAAPIDPQRLLPGAADGHSAGAAWANVTAPSLNLPIGWDKASVDARFDPVQDQRKLGTSVSKSLPLGAHWSVTLQNGYSVTQSPHHSAGMSAASSSNAGSATVAASQPAYHSTYATEHSAKLNLPTGTAFSVGSSLSSDEEKWLRKLSAEQKLFDAITVTGSVSETATGIPDRSLTAGFKRTW